MVGEGGVSRPAEGRVSTGNPSLDRMLEGGLVPHRPYLIVGPSGTGKTTLAIQFLCEGVRHHERVLLVTLEEPPNEAKVNHRGLDPELSRVEVFDAIPDIMRYERTPFKDIASVRTAVPFHDVPLRIRQSPELSSVEVTITALEQMLRTEVIRRNYTRIVIDSLTALQYFCMKGFDPVSGAQSFLRFLSDLRVTTLLTVESPLEDIDTPERMLARGEIRLFRWELDGQTVRAVGVEKFRGSSHDVRLHPYRIGPQGIDINLDVTISRDTRQIIEPLVPRLPVPPTAVPGAPLPSSVTPLIDEVRDLILLGEDVAPARSEIEAALAATDEGHLEAVQAHLSRVSSLVMGLVDHLGHGPAPGTPPDPTAAAALQRVLARVDSVRTGVPPTSLPAPPVLHVQLGALLSLLPAPPPTPPPTPVAEPAPPVAPAVPEPSAPAPPPVEAAPAPEPTAAVPPTPVAPVEPPVAPPTTEPLTPPGPPATAPPPSEPSLSPQVPLPETARPVPEPILTPRVRTGRGLAAPPKPRPPATGPRVSRTAPTPSTRGAAAKVGPPPLPTTQPPAWPSAPGPLGETAPESTSPTRPAAPASSAPGEVPAHAAPTPTKRRRKAAPTAPSKRATHPRTAPTHPPAMPPPTPVIPTEGELASHPPAEPVSPPATESVAAPKSRRRAARKRKAPPVISATVVPIPPGVFGATPDETKPPNDPDPPSPSEE